MKDFGEPRVHSPVDLKRNADLLAALAHPIRLQIVDGLLAGHSDVGSMVECLGHPQALISRHLKVLTDAGLIVRRVEGTTRPCRLAPGGLAELDAYLARLRDALEHNYRRLDRLLATPPRTRKDRDP